MCTATDRGSQQPTVRKRDGRARFNASLLLLLYLLSLSRTFLTGGGLCLAVSCTITCTEMHVQPALECAHCCLSAHTETVCVFYLCLVVSFWCMLFGENIFSWFDVSRLLNFPLRGNIRIVRGLPACARPSFAMRVLVLARGCGRLTHELHGHRRQVARGESRTSAGLLSCFFVELLLR